MNTENRKTNEPHKFRLTLSGKINLIDMALANLSINYTRKNIKSAYNKNKFKFLLQLGLMNFICLMDHIIFETFKIILDTLLKNIKL